jgi:cellulose synthase (UDP-forming)
MRVLRRLPAGAATALLALSGAILVWTAATVALEPLQQAALAVGSVLVFAIGNRVRGRPMTLFLVVLSAAVSIRYILWRFTETLDFATPLQGALGSGLALAELYAVLVLALGYVQTVWPLERKPLPLPDVPADWPTVDIYVPTYNEDLSVVRATVLAAMTIDWPRDKLRVYILDDGRRRAFRDFAASCGAGYINRPDNAHAKAGNLNHAMRLTDGDFIAIFDCDHVPTRAFLQMTMGWMVADPGLALMQTPHHFYSPDPFQRNLAAGTRVPAEGNMFYGLIQDGNDFWDAAFFCGSCAVLRRTAVESIGGFAVETVTEDAHTALKMHRRGWRSAYLRVPLAAGLATERLVLHIGQRMRWARGMLQILRIDNPLFGPGLSFGQRVCYLNAMMHFFFALPRVVFLTAPLAFLLLGQNIIAASPLAIVAYALPHIFHSVATNARLQGRWRHSFWSEIYETVLALFLVRVTVATMINPRGGKFNVTDKGGLLSNGYFDMRAVYPNLLLAAVLVAGLLRGFYGLVVEGGDTLAFQAFLLNTIWVSFSLLIVMGALAVGRETRQVRRAPRVRARLPVTVLLPDGRAVQGTSHNLSAGGGAMFVERVGGLPPDTEVDLEFSLGSERLLVPARIQRWEARTLQVNWRTDSIAAESRVAQLVFGRADAWLDWDRFAEDRPLQSLWRVLVSIRGLFRPRGQAIAAAERDAGAAPVAAAVGTLPRESLVLQPRGLVRAALVALAMVVPTAVHAQVPGLPVMAGPGPAGPAVRPYPAPVPALPPAPLPAAALVRPAVVVPLPPLGADMRRVTLSMHDLGASQPMTMRGTSAIQGILFGVRNDEVVTDARLSLSGAMSPALIPELSAVTVTLNEQYVGTIQAERDRPQFGPMEMAVNPVFFQDRNRLNFRFAGRYTQECNDQLSGLLWAIVSEQSTLTLTLARLPAQRDLARLPLPLFDANVRGKLVLPFVLPAAAGAETLQASAIVASWFGRLAGFRGTAFPVGVEPPPEGNAVLVATTRDAPASLGLPMVSGPTLLLVGNPNDPSGTLLVVTGRTGAEVQAAATSLALGARLLSGAALTVPAPVVPARRAYDAPRWVATDRPVRFGELVDAGELQGTGYVPGTFHVPFHTSADLYTWRQRPYAADIRFRSPPGSIIQVAASRLDVSMNGLYLRSFSLAPVERPWDWLAARLGFAVTQHRGATAVPPWTVFGSIDLQLFFDARPLDLGACVAIPEDIKLSVDPESTFDLSNAYHFTELPNLAFFVSSGFPFTRMADLSETAVVLPDRPGTVELSAFLGLMGRLGSLTGYPVLRVTVLRGAEATAAGDKDLILVGTLGRLGVAEELLRASPYRPEGNALRVVLSHALPGIWRLFGDARYDEAQRAAAALAAPLGGGAAAMIGAASPSGHGRSVLAVLAGEPQGLDAMVNALDDPVLVPDIQGDLALLSAGRMTSWRAGPTYAVGYLPPWLWPDWLLRDRPLWILLIMVMSAVLLGLALLRTLLARAATRIGRRRQG